MANDRVLLLRRFAYGETSLVCQALSRRHGRVHWIAKGAYRPKSRFYAVLDLFDTLEASWTDSPRRDLAPLREARLATRRHRIATDLGRYRAALSVLELAGAAAQRGQPVPDLFDLTEAALDRLAALRAPAALVLTVFELRYLHGLGIAPSLRGCAACGSPAPEAVAGSGRAAFSAGAGGRLCRACAEEARSSGRRVGTLPVRVLELAASWLESGPDDLDDARPEASDLDLVRDFVARYVEYQLEGRPKSYRSFLAVPNRNRPSA